MVRSMLAATALVVAAGWAWGDDSAPTKPQSQIQTAAELAAAHAGAAEQTSPDKPVAFGLRVSRATDLVRRHLALGHGVGLVVDDVVAGSPAAQAGIERYDVLVEIDGQSLIVPEQFQALIEATGDAAPRQFVVIRAGKKQVISLNGAAPSSEASATALPKRPLAPTASVWALLPANTKTALKKPAPARPRPPVVRRDRDYGLVQEGSDYSIALSRDSETRLVVRDARGLTIFHDAIETPEQRSRIPLAVRDRVEQLESKLPQREQPTAPVAATAATPAATTAPTTVPTKTTKATKTVAEIGRLDIPPVEVK